METARNTLLAAWMEDQQLSARALADLVNREVGEITGRLGGLDDSSIRAWRSGRVRCPKSVQLRALENVSGKPAADLGFDRRSRTPGIPPRQETPPVERRTLITAAVGAVVAAVGSPPAAAAAPRRIGMSDVARLQQRFTDIIAADHRHGGRTGIEHQARALAGDALRLQQQGAASQRVRASLYAAAAAFWSSAMWAAIDGRRFNDARGHLREAQNIASMSGDQAIQFRIWSHAGTMYRHMNRPGDADAANTVARNLGISRRDPMFASLGLARHGAIHATAGDRRSTDRAFGQAQEALDRSDAAAHRPVWLTAFYDRAEIHALALSAYLSLGDWETAESHGYRCLAELRPHMRRSLAITTTRLARAQLEQGEAERAVATAMQIPAEAAASHPRVTRMLAGFGQRLTDTAPHSPQTAVWRDYTARVTASAR
ncbi:XRE family transcriptional regulator [Streptomyces sp. CJ_13]|uniref:XRE family transcriptional regulator n=1 Tax=Streptomyces sp. CJ_13 TaxID=2724943 RepID=UPI001BDC26A9|nr:XRE family transcriptional regulator [Streptomyces sp. CJ_13]MBT1187878.1 XRE family transcriptional regulator [Streptomyces sp. CJ_13]